jgi:hypothetical protein
MNSNLTRTFLAIFKCIFQTGNQEFNDDAKTDSVAQANKTGSSEAPNPKPRKSIQVDESLKLSRSKTMPPSSSPTTAKKDLPAKPTVTINKDLNPDRLKMAKEEAERAIKVNLS